MTPTPWLLVRAAIYLDPEATCDITRADYIATGCVLSDLNFGTVWAVVFRARFGSEVFKLAAGWWNGRAGVATAISFKETVVGDHVTPTSWCAYPPNLGYRVCYSVANIS